MTTSHTVVLGRLGKNPETRQAGGKNVTQFSLAVNDGTKQNPHTTWFNCTAWEKTGDMIAQYASKGELLFVSGQMKSRDYTDKNGQERTVWELTVRDFTLMPKQEATRASVSVDAESDVAF